jgi:hypothetical protein
MATKGITGIVALGLLLLATSAHAQTAAPPDTTPKPAEVAPPDPVLDAAAQEIGRALYLRCLCTAEKLSFNAQGRMDDGVKSQPVDWTLAGVNVQKVERKGPEAIELEGVRVGVRWNPDVHEFQRRDIKEQAVHILIAGDANQASAERTLQAVFSIGIDHAFQLSTPLYWKHYFFPAMAWPADALDGVAIAHVGDKINGIAIESPQQTKHVTTEYTPEATVAHLQGPAILQIIVDAQGAPHRIRIVQPLGYGLDAVAAVAAEKSMFAPPMAAGKPSAISFYARANFSIHEIPSF